MKSHKHIFVLADNQANLDQKWTDIVRVGDWTNSYKEFQLKKEDLNSMIKNFENNVLNLDKGELQFNYSHMAHAEAAGWIQSLKVEGDVLQAQVRWTPKAQERIEGEEFKYVSAEIDFGYRDEESGERHGVTLTGAALTNIPFVRGMKAVALSNSVDKDVTLLFHNPLPKMDAFKKLLSTLQGNENVTLGEVAVLKGAMAMLSEEEQAEVQPDVDAVEETAEANAEAEEQAEEEAQAEAEAKEAELAEAKKQAELAGKSVDAQVTTLSSNLEAAQKQLSEQQKELDKMKHDARNSEMEQAVKALSEAGKLLPKDVDATVALLMDLSVEKAEKWLAHFDGMPARVKLGEEGFTTDQDKVALDAVAKIPDSKVQELAQSIAKEQNITIEKAVSKALDQLTQ